MSQETLEEALERKIFDKLSAKFQEFESNTKKLSVKFQEFESSTKKQIHDLRNDTNGKIQRLSVVDQSAEWKHFKSGISVTSAPSKDDPSIFQLSQDLYSILATASWRSVPFWISMFIIFGFQFSLLVLLLTNQLDINSDNPLNLPANVESQVRISQVLLIIIALFSQDDLLAGVESLLDGFPDIFRGSSRLSGITRLQWRLSSIIRLSQGLLNLLAAFVLAIQSETVPDVLLNVLGVGFVSSLDDLAFRLSMKGYFGRSMKTLAEDLVEVRFHRAAQSQNTSSVLAKKIKDSAHIIIAFALLLSGMVVFGIFAVQQDIGLYSEQDIRVEFGDEVLPFLGLFNGCYKASDSSENIDGRLVYEQAGYPNGGKFGYCSDFGEGDSGWAFFIGEPQDDICKNYVLRSGETSTFSVLEAGKTDWYTSDDLALDSLEITEIKNPNSECGQSIFEFSNENYCPSVMAFESMVMSRLEASVDVNAGRGLDASISHTIYYYNETIDNVDRFTLIFFSGRRWLRTRSSEHIPPLAGNETSLSDVRDFFANGGLYAIVDRLRDSNEGQTLQWFSAVSESVDTARDQGSPVGLQWYGPRYETVAGTAEDEKLQRNFPSANLASPILTSLECLYCNDESNPCFYDGVCDTDTGKCDCKYGTSGNLCDVLPLKDGICNLYFNKAEYNYDGGDCCAWTCEGDTCGEDDLPNPFSTAVYDVGWNWNHFPDRTEEWNETYRGLEFAFGVDVDSENIRYISSPPFRYSHCEDPHSALLIVEHDVGTFPEGFQDRWLFGTSVRCDGTLYLRTPNFAAKLKSGTSFVEKVRVPYGANCVFSIDYQVANSNAGQNDSNYNVALFAEKQPVPFLKQERAYSVPIQFQIPDSVCVWTTFVENLVFAFIDGELDGNSNGHSLGWNGYLSEKDYAKFTQGVQLGSICNSDPGELLERYAVWKISESVPGDDDLSGIFVGHICDAAWAGEYLSVICNDRHVTQVSIYFSNHLPSELGLLTSATWLDLLWNEVTSLPSEIGQMASLAYLIMEDHLELTSLPPEIGKLPSLRWLVVTNSPLGSVPPEIGQLTSLDLLELGKTQLMSIPSEIGQLTLLTYLAVYDNQLTSLPLEIGRLTSLENIALENNQLVSIPPETGSLTSLTSLGLENNQLTSLPPEIGQLASLTELKLKYNQVTLLPSEIGRLTSLASLDLWDNLIASIPSEIGRLTALTGLDLDDNQLTSLPSEIGRLTSMTWFALANNQLTSFPPEVVNWTSLRWLNLESNRFTPLPSEIGSLSSLTLLNLFFNPLTANSIPTEISSLASLETLLVCADDGGYGCGDNNCTDNVGFLDASGGGCHFYEANDFCSDAVNYINRDGISANEACCFCGGGVTTSNGE